MRYLSVTPAIFPQLICVVSTTSKRCTTQTNSKLCKQLYFGRASYVEISCCSVKPSVYCYCLLLGYVTPSVHQYFNHIQTSFYTLSIRRNLLLCIYVCLVSSTSTAVTLPIAIALLYAQS